MMSEAERKAAYSANPMIVGFLVAALEDLQFTENDEACMDEREARDVGTIYTAPDCTFLYAKRECEQFATGAAAEHCNGLRHELEQIGSDLYLERAGHGTGFRDRTWDADPDTSREIGEALSAAVPDGSCETYIGDDGQMYFVGGESLS